MKKSDLKNLVKEEYHNVKSFMEEKYGFVPELGKVISNPYATSFVNEAKEPDVITQLRKIVKNKQNDLIKDTKSGKKVRVDMNSANLMVQVYDALKQQSNKDKFVKSGIVMMGHMAYKLMKKESVNEGFKSEYKGNDGIVWKKGKSRGDVTNFTPYYKGHDIDKGGHNFKTEKELKDFIKDYILSNQLYNKYRFESVNEGKYDGMLDVIEDLVSKAKSFMDVGNQLKKHKVKYSFSTSMIPMYKLDKLPIAIVNKKYVDKADREVGDIAIGLMESIKESVLNENKYSIIDPRGNAAGTGTKDQANRRAKQLGGNKKGYFVVPAHRAKEARRAMERFKFNFKNAKLQDKMSGLYFDDEMFGESAVNEDKVDVLRKLVQKINRKYKVNVSSHPVTKGEVEIILGSGNHPDGDYHAIDKLVSKLGIKKYSIFSESVNENDSYSITDDKGRHFLLIVGEEPKDSKGKSEYKKDGFYISPQKGFKGLITAYFKDEKTLKKNIDKKYHNQLGESINEAKVHFEKKLKSGNIFQVIDRDMKGMRRPEKEDKFLMQIVDKKGKVVKHIGSHPSLSGAKKYSNSLNEGVMSDINMMSKQAKTLDDFLKKFFKEYGKQIKKNSDTINWATDLYNGVNEAKLGDIKKAVRNRPNPYSLVISRNGKVIDQVHIQNPNEAPAMFRVLKKKHPNDLVALEDSSGRILFTEYVQEYDVDTIEEAKDFVNFMKEYKSDINEAEYQGRDVKLGKPMQGDVKKFKVYVKNPKGNVVKVNFGHGGSSAKGKTMSIRKNNPDARKAFRARHNCDNPGPRHKARYWSCRKW